MNSTHSCWLHQGIQEMAKASAVLMYWGGGRGSAIPDDIVLSTMAAPTYL
ncbi:rCG50899 [Rattus norvegicus]|uniref:RCG50899 n=1 Tax=Rattus norvegicus TaxID=10116 RepID=A6KIZ6_RAT|nr:rCG50899 [Rattus norvegicus]